MLGRRFICPIVQPTQRIKLEIDGLKMSPRDFLASAKKYWAGKKNDGEMTEHVPD